MSASESFSNLLIMKTTSLAVVALISFAIPSTGTALRAQQSAATSSAKPSRSAPSVAHPLDPLDRAEIAAAVRIIKAADRFPSGALFPIVVLKEPPKDEVLAYQQGAPFRREAFAVVYDRATNKTFEAVADLRAGSVSLWEEKAGVQPGFLVEELSSAPAIVKADPRWQEAMKRRGFARS